MNIELGKVYRDERDGHTILIVSELGPDTFGSLWYNVITLATGNTGFELGAAEMSTFTMRKTYKLVRSFKQELKELL